MLLQDQRHLLMVLTFLADVDLAQITEALSLQFLLDGRAEALVIYFAVPLL